MHRLLTFALPILLIASQATQAAVYQWTDANGQTHFGDRPPSQAQTREVAVDAAHKLLLPPPGIARTEFA